MADGLKTPNDFKRNLREGKKQYGLWLSLDSPMATEIVAGSGYDWLLLDLEHNCIDLSSVVNHLRAAKGGTAEVVVRLPWNDPVVFKRLLDLGVRSFMVPLVQSAEEAHAAVAATRYPPHGIRGAAANTRASSFNRITDYFENTHENICIVVQIETVRAVDAIAEIGAVDGVDGLFVGPSDLSASMGLAGKAALPQVKEMITKALGLIKKTGKAPGLLNFVPPDARSWVQAGFQFVAVGADGAIVARRSESLLQEIKSTS